MEHLGVEAQKQYAGDGIAITPTAEGAFLRAAFQKLHGRVTAGGLWMESVEQAGKSDRFRVMALAIGGTGEPLRSFFPTHGQVQVGAESAAFVRSDIIEEYRVSMDGVRQDFVIPERPSHSGDLSLALEVIGAQVQAAHYGAKLTLQQSGREIAYCRLHVTDARGKELAARFVVAGPSQLEICVDDAEAVYPVRIDPTFSDADWMDMEGSPGTNGTVYATAVDASSNLYIGGAFTQLGAFTGSYIVRWNGTAWSTLGTGLNGEVRALLVSGSNLYVGGSFTTAGGNAAAKIAKWDGTDWSSVGTGMNGTVLALTGSGSDIYAGGEFTTAGGTGANYIAKWNGSAWSALGDGTSGPVRALGVSGTFLYAGGAFVNAGGIQVNNIARWNGTWTALGVGATAGTIAAVNCLAFSADGSLHVGGGFGTAGGVGVSNIGRWTGSTWVGLGTGLNGPAMAMTVSGTNLYVAGSFTNAGGTSAPGIARWSTTGLSWNALSSGITGTVNALTVSGANVYAGGTFVKAGTVTVNNVAKWDGSAWNTIRPAGINNEVSALAFSGTSLYVGGSFTSVGGVSASRIAKWDGSNWSALGTGTSDTVKALAVSGANVYAGGSFVTAGETTVNSVAKWNGSVWSAMGTGVSGNVLALAISGANVYAGGTFTTAGAVSASHIARWDGTAWSAVGAGVNGDVNALAVAGTSVYAGGLFTSAGAGAASNVARWNGTAWSALGLGTSDEVAALLVSGADLYAGGIFVSAGGLTVNRIAKWNGAAWSALGTGVNDRVNALALSGSYLYAGGLFTEAGGSGASSIARWNGKAWSPLGSGTNSVVKTLATSSSQLYVGGGFTTAGAKNISYVAQAALPLEPEISVRGNATEIVSGDSTPALDNFTDFGPANVIGGTVTRSFEIANLSTTASLNLTGDPKVVIGGDNAADFAVTVEPSGSIAISSTTTVTIRFDPSAAGVRSASVSIQTDDQDEDPYTFAIQGTGGEPEIAVSGNGMGIASQSAPPSLANHTEFGYALTGGGSVTRTFTIANLGTAPLSRSATPMVTIAGAVAGNFTVQAQPVNPVAVSGSATFAVVFAPSALGPQSAVVHIATDDADEPDYSFEVAGTGAVPGTVSFQEAVYTVHQGVANVQLTLVRSGGSLATSVAVNTDDGPTSISPPYAAAVAGTDYVDLAGDSAIASFDDNENTQTVIVELPTRPASAPNRRFSVTLSAISGQAQLGAITTATVEILATDTVKPRLTITTPKAGPVNAASPFTVDVTGIAGDARGLTGVTVKLNEADPVPALLGAATVPTSVPYSLAISPVEGPNTVEVVATDLRGNVSKLTRSFIFTRRYPLTLARVIPGDTTLTLDQTGAVAMVVTPGAAASKLEPTIANSNPRIAYVAAGASVKLTAAVKAGSAFSHWAGLPAESVVAGETVTFIMPALACSITAHFVENPFEAPNGMGNIFYGLLHADAESSTAPANSTEGFLTATMTTKGGLTGKLFIDGVIQAFAATAYGDGSTFFTVSGKKLSSLTFGTKNLTLRYNAGEGNNALSATLTDGDDISQGTAKRAMHTTANPVGTALLNSATKGYYTVAFPSKAQLPEKLPETYPQGSSYGTVTLAAAGTATFAVSLADGTVFTASSALIEGEVAPLFAQLTTPGAAAAVKGGSFGGTLAFEIETNSDVSGTDLLWFRPAVVAKTTPAAAAAATNLYTDGWPTGVKVDAVGALYNTLLSVQFSLGLGSAQTEPGNVELLFTDGKLVNDVSYTALKIDFNTIIQVPAKDPRYTLIATPKTGFFNGTFTPDWLSPNLKLPTYKGIMIQKGSNKGGYGYFLSNALDDLDPESGNVTLFKPVPES